MNIPLQRSKQLETKDYSAEPDWSNSSTLQSEMWKNPLLPKSERLEIADGAIAYRNEVIKNLRRQLKLALVTSCVLDKQTVKYNIAAAKDGMLTVTLEQEDAVMLELCGGAEKLAADIFENY